MPPTSRPAAGCKQQHLVVAYCCGCGMETCVMAGNLGLGCTDRCASPITPNTLTLEHMWQFESTHTLEKV